VQIRFGAFTLDLDTRQLVHQRRAVPLSPKAFALLVALASERPRVLSKDELQKRLWPDSFVAEANLSNLVTEIRHALGDRARSPQYIRTAHGFGYAFCGDASTIAHAQAPIAASAPCWLEWGRRRFDLALGENVVGRDADVDVQLDASTVSRRHARIVVSRDGAIIEDLVSKNGTFRNDTRLAAPTLLADGDSLGFGSLLVTFRIRAGLRSTETQARTGSPR
jgi:DNA-binding winged helix-turn-helix (wHTH) protein